MNTSLLNKVMTEPAIVTSLSNASLNLLICQARVSGLTARLYLILNSEGHLNSLPQKIQSQLKNAMFPVDFLRKQVLSEAKVINLALSSSAITAIYLKGAAYSLLDLPLAKSRLFSDIDILVKKDVVSKAEVTLKCLGWISQKSEDYDQRYYREFMHEIPPIQHFERGSVIDLHHNILPICGDNIVNIEKLTQNTQEIDGTSIRTLSNEAMFIHCATHLFHEGEFEKGLRDLSDLAMLYEDFESKNKQFSGSVICLAKDLGLEKQLYFAFYYIKRILRCSLSSHAEAFATQHRKTLKLAWLYDFIFDNVLIPHHSSCSTWKASIAKQLAYYRGHLIRMPLRLLLPHLTKKAFMQILSIFGEKSKDVDTKKRPDF